MNSGEVGNTACAGLSQEFISNNGRNIKQKQYWNNTE